MEFLLRYNNNDKNELITAAEPKESINVLLKYLDRAGIALVDNVPDKQGLFCVNEKVAYCVYQSVFNKEDNTFESYLIYSLQWLPWTEKHAKSLEEFRDIPQELAFEAAAELPDEPPALIRS
jgi:hypothetical protein